MDNELLRNLDKLHSTPLGFERIRKNLGLDDAGDTLSWCQTTIRDADDIVRRGKNWYVYAGDLRITVNAHSYTVITAHRGKAEPVPAETRQEEPCQQEDLREALRAIDSTIRKCEKALPKLTPGTSQHTLLTRRIKAFHIAAVLIRRELDL